MIRIHLAQIFYNPSYYDPPVDYLEEPSSIIETDTPIGKIRSIEQIQSFLIDSKSSCIEYLRKKLTEIARWSGDRGAHLLAFPEYSVPLQILPDLKEVASKYSMIIIAGTHRIPSGDEAKLIYQGLGINIDSVPLGYAVSPILLPDGSVSISKKLRKSKWEINLAIPMNENPKIISTDCRGISIRLSVVPCIDSIHPDVIGKLWENSDNAPHLIVCPSFSPSIDPFRNIGSLSALQETLFAYVNTASFGGTSFYLPKDWNVYLEGFPPNANELPKNGESILELNVDLQNFFAKRGSVKNVPTCTFPFSFPIIHTNKVTWLSKFLELRKDLIEWLTNNDKESAIDWLDSYLLDEAARLPDPVLQNLKYARHSLLPLYDGNIDSITKITELVKISDGEDDPMIFWAKRVNNAMQLLTEYFKVATNDTTDLLKCLQGLKKLQQTLPAIHFVTTPEIHKVSTPLRDEKFSFVGEENLAEAFQNRGPDLDMVRNFLTNKENRVIIVTGAIGIGKSDFINLMFRKAFVDWNVIRIKVPSEARISRIIADIGYQLGISLDVDSLACASHKVFRQKVRKILIQFYNTAKRALIIDDLHEILRVRNAREYRLLAIFLEEAATPGDYQGGRIFLVSSQWLPEKWLNSKGVSYLRLRGISDMYIQRIVEYHMRRASLIPGEAPLEVPNALLEIIKGHPLSARLVAEVLRDSDIRRLSDELTIKKVAGHIAQELLKRVELSSSEESIMKRISVFRLPTRIDVLKSIEQLDINEIQLLDLADRCILSYDGNTFEMHEAIRRFYYSKISESDLKQFHGLAALYYKNIHEDQRVSGAKDPNIIGEMIHHLSLSGELSEVKKLRLLVVEELKATARKIYREYRNWPNALSLYRLLAEIVPDDAEVLAYVGRCYGRLFRWDESDQAFNKAIDMAKRTGRPTWWIYRDWGHIRARFGFYSVAEQCFDIASKSNPNDPSIKANLAYIRWRQGDKESAYSLFEEALHIEPYHEYTLAYYPKFLDSFGMPDYANILRERLTEIESGTRYVEPLDYDIEFDQDDI